MPNFMSRGLNWLQDQRHKHMAEEIRIGFTLPGSFPLLATIVEQEVESSSEVVRQQAQIFRFIVRREDLEKHNIKLHRGMKIWYLDDTYEIGFDRNQLYEYNDPNRNDVIIKASLVNDNESIT